MDLGGGRSTVLDGGRTQRQHANRRSWAPLASGSRGICQVQRFFPARTFKLAPQSQIARRDGGATRDLLDTLRLALVLLLERFHHWFSASAGLLRTDTQDGASHTHLLMQSLYRLFGGVVCS